MLNARAVAKLGYLYLNQGVWDGQQIVPSKWVATSTTQHTSGTSASSGVNLAQAGHGYIWWVTEAAGTQAYFAFSYGSQVIYVVPGLDLVVVPMGAADRRTATRPDPAHRGADRAGCLRWSPCRRGG